MECGRNFNTKVRGEKHTHVIEDHILVVDGNQKIQIKEIAHNIRNKYNNNLISQSRFKNQYKLNFLM